MNVAPPFSSGAGGPDFEARVASSLVCSTLAGVLIPPLTAQIENIWLQAGHLDCAVEDIVFETTVNGRRHRCFCSVKSTVTPLAGDSEFKETISRSWKDWCNKKVFDRSSDQFLLATSTSRSPRIPNFLRLTEIARASLCAKDFFKRISIDKYHRRPIRATLHEVSAIIQKEAKELPAEQEIWQFLHHFFVQTYDFDSDSSQDKQRVIGLLRLASTQKNHSGADAIWNKAFELISSSKGRAEAIDLTSLFDLVKSHSLAPLPESSSRWLKNLRAHCKTTRGLTTSTVGSEHIDRESLSNQLKELILESRFTLISGPPGSGKSSLAINCSENQFKAENVFCFNADEFNYQHIDTALEAAGLKEITPSEWADALPFEERVIVIDSLERILQSVNSYVALDQLLKLIKGDRRWRIVATCRDYFASHVRMRWNEAWHEFEVPLLSDEELTDLRDRKVVPSSWFKVPDANSALRNLKWIDLALRSLSASEDRTESDQWRSIAEWRHSIWQNLVRPDAVPEGQELLIKISLDRLESGKIWFVVSEQAIQPAKFLFDQGLLIREDPQSNRFRSEHDLLEDWALIAYVQRMFKEHREDPARFFHILGSHILLRRAFRQLFSELLDGREKENALNFIDRVFSKKDAQKIWKEEILIGILGSSSASEIVVNSSEVFHLEAASLLKELYHILQIAFVRLPEDEHDEKKPVGAGWPSLFKFITSQGRTFIHDEIETIFDVLVVWHVAVTEADPQPLGLREATNVAREVWTIATTDEERFERLSGQNGYLPTVSNPLYSVIAHVASALGESFFREQLRIVLVNRRSPSSTNGEIYRRASELITFLTTDYRGWVLAKFFPSLMAKICIQSFGISRRFWAERTSSFRDSEHPFSIGRHEFESASALHGPFLQLLRTRRGLAFALIRRLVHIETDLWIHEVNNGIAFADSAIQVKLSINEDEAVQVGDQGWWRAYRGHSPIHPLTESALMALESWLLGEIAHSPEEDPHEIIRELLRSTYNIAFLAVATSVSQVSWWNSGYLIASILQSDFRSLITLDRHRLHNELTNGGWGIWEDVNDVYIRERRISNGMEHRRSELEQLILKSQFGVGRDQVWKAIDLQREALNHELQSEDTMIRKAILHRIDSRNFVSNPASESEGGIVFKASPPPEEIQQFLESSSADAVENFSLYELQNWARAILEPLGTVSADIGEWEAMLTRAQGLAIPDLSSDRKFIHGETPILVASVCVIRKWSELSNDQKEWSLEACIQALKSKSTITDYRNQGLIFQWSAERASARACGFAALLQNDSIIDKKRSEVFEALSIALTLPDKHVRYAAAETIGSCERGDSLGLAASKLLVNSARLIREVEIQYRGPHRDDNDGLDWPERCQAMHERILEGTQRLRDEFVHQSEEGNERLSRYYPRGIEEEERLSAVVAASRSGKSAACAELIGRVFDWMLIQEIASGRPRGRQRMFGRDQWRDHCSHPRANPVVVGEVERELARFTLSLNCERAVTLVSRYLSEDRIMKFGLRAGFFLKNLCLSLDLGGSPDVFWTIWAEHVKTAFLIWRSSAKDSRMPYAMSSLVEAIFLDRMYFQRDQEWSEIEVGLKNLAAAFSVFGAVGLESYIRFIFTIGGDALPAEWPNLEKVISQRKDFLGARFLSQNSQEMLLKLIGDSVSADRIPLGSQEIWRSVRSILDYLIDFGHAEAFILRERIARI